MTVIPDKIGRLRKRAGEPDDSWAARYEAERVRRENNPPKASTRKGTNAPAWHKIDPAVLENAREVFSLTDDDVVRYGTQPPPNPYIHYTPTPGDTTLRDGLEWVRFMMTGWVCETWRLKISEARCDLDCSLCRGPMALNCAAHNEGVAALDGHSLPITTLRG